MNITNNLSLEPLLNFFKNFNNIHNNVKNVIHVAGTNGKGSTVAFMRHILEYNGFSVNVFTSPHLVEENERIRIKGTLISNSYVKEIRNQIKDIENYDKLSLFEEYTAIAFIAFANNPADFCILEVGLGGRLDATNIITSPLLNVITSISADHTEILGNTLALIAKEKAGIIKASACAVVSDVQDSSVMEVLQTTANQKTVKFLCGGVDYKIIGSVLHYNNLNINLDNLGLRGKHQYNNAALAIVSLMQIPNIKLELEQIYEGLKNTTWPARLQQFKTLYGIDLSNQHLFIDGGHNPGGAEIIVDFVKQYVKLHNVKHVYIMLGMLQRKSLSDVLNILAALNNMDASFTLMPLLVEDFESYSVSDVKSMAINLHINTLDNMFKNTEKYTTEEAISSYLKQITSTNNNLVIICGSLYLMGKILQDNK